MDELYVIMRELLEVEYDQKALLRVLETLESACEEPEQEEVRLIVHHIKGSIKSRYQQTGQLYGQGSMR